HALQSENWALFDFLLDHHANPNAQDPDGLPLLAMAVENQDGERIGRLFEAEVDVNVSGRSGDSLLMEAVGRGDEDFADQLLKHGAEPNQAGDSGQTALFAAVKSGSTAMAALLLENGADPNLTPKKRPAPLEIATASQDADLMRVLIEAGADVKPARLMKTAFENRDLSAITTLLRAGADPDVSVGNGKTILDLALADESENIALTLLESGASAKGKLWSALGTGNEELVNMVLRFGASVGERDPERGLPLDYALEQGNGTFVATMLAYGANPNVMRKDGESWVAAAIRQGNEDVVDALLDHGACTEGLTSADGQSLLSWAIAHDMTKVAKRLIEEGADVRGYVSAPASDEFTAAFDRSKTFRWHLQADSKLNPLHLAAAKGNVEIAQALMEAGAKSGDSSRRYLWPVNIAAWHMDVPMMQVILGRDPDPDKQPRKVIIDLGSQRATLYEGGKSVYSTQVSTGKSGYRTPTGVYVITDKHRHHNSTLYGSSMPYFMRLSCAAFGLHQGYVPNYPASHGCIRVPYSGAKHLFSVCEVGDVVEITH
ncbi:MAG: ankyrin repeat domain-containing protein, partial [Verrucomicrobiae bacterium]|nr:ankyrin repeat domain-containing protein [Verrucomicrobiae bacterium]